MFLIFCIYFFQAKSMLMVPAGQEKLNNQEKAAFIKKQKDINVKLSASPSTSKQKQQNIYKSDNLESSKDHLETASLKSDTRIDVEANIW